MCGNCGSQRGGAKHGGRADSMVHPYGMVPFILLGATGEQDEPRSRPFDKDETVLSWVKVVYFSCWNRWTMHA